MITKIYNKVVAGLFYLFLCSTTPLLLQSCSDYLDTKSYSEANAEFVFSNMTTARAAMDGAYSQWHGAISSQIFGDGLYYALDVAGSDIMRHPEKYTAQPLRHVPECFYVNGTAVSSDKRKKEYITPLDWRYEEFFRLLEPASFKYKDGTSGRRHTGFIAQEVEEAQLKAGLDDKDLAIVVKDEEGNYYLRYEEIIAVQTEVIQKLMAKVDTLETRLARLEGLLANK